MKRPSKLRRVVLDFRGDGKVDVTRERTDGTGERFTGCRDLDEAFAMVRAHP